MNDVVDQIQAASSDSVPVIDTPLDNTVQLLRGLHVQETDDWHTTAVVRELTGADEEYLFELGARDDVTYTEYTSGFLERAVVSIGSLPAKGITNKLILPDRDVLFLAITKATYGKDKEVSTVCPHCGHEQNIILELEKDFPIVGADRDYRSYIEVELSKGMVQLRYPTGEDTAYATKKAKNLPHLNTLILARCIVAEGQSIEERIEWAQELGVADRRKVDKAITDSTTGVGPQLEGVDTHCAECNGELSLKMDWVSLLLG